MSTVKISQLPLISAVNANTSNTLFAVVDIPTGATGKMTAHTLSQGLYSNEVLNVGVNQQNLPNTIAQFALSGESYIQTNLVNTNDGGTADIVVTANTGSGGTDAANFIDMGWANKNYQAGLEFNNIGTAIQPNDGYLYVQGTSGQKSGNLVVGTTTSGTQLKFTVGGGQAANIVARFTSNALVLNTQSHLTFSDGSSQYVAAAPANYTQSAFDAANTNASNITVIQGVNVTQNTNLTSVNQYAASAYNQANTNASNILGANAYSLQVNQYAAAAYAQANATIGVDATQNTNILNANAYTLTVNQFAQSAYNVANNALANTTGTFAGDLTTTGNVITGYIRSRYASITDNAPLASFVATPTGAFLNPSNSGYIVHAVGREGVTSRIALDTIGAGTVPNYLTRHVRGTATAPTPTQSGDIIGRFSAFGYGNTAFNTASDARIDMGATENFTDAAHGTTIQLYTTPAGANTIRLAAQFSTGNTSLLSSNTYIGGNVTINGTTILTGNLIANSVGQSISVDNFTSNTATFNRNLVVNGTITANTLLGNVFFSNVTTVTTQANSIQWFAQQQSPAQTDGQVWYSANTISLIQDTDIAGDRPAISKVLFERVYNGTGSAIPSSSWVRLAGGVTSNSVPFIQLADATSAANSQVEGFIKVGIAAGAYGFVYTRGIVEGMNASSFGTNGQLLFLSTTPGQASNIAPTGTNSVVSVAKILSNGSANGKLQIVIANQQAYGKPNGAILFANNNLIQASNTLFINEALGQLNVSSTIYAANGIINKSNTYTGTQTAITVNLATEMMVKATVGASLTITPTGFGPGLEAEVIITNPNTGGGAARTITHGCSAINSSVGATTFNLGGTTTAFVKYYSFDGDLANTYVKISYS
jgi:hypothetical protein